MGKIQSFKDLIAWQKAFLLVKEIYRITGNMPVEERFGLMSQIRRSAVSIPSNIAEGYGRRRLKEYDRFLSIALGSLNELETQLLLIHDLGYTSKQSTDECLKMIEETGRLLGGLIKKLNS
ncbi:MAG: four helix bundle protein [Chitinispirillaceae bacterium]|nr:four helix bundle protein [Chitinispirillaceae bacterium]